MKTDLRNNNYQNKVTW